MGSVRITSPMTGAAAAETAAEALDRANNVRQMILNRDPKIASLEQLAESVVGLNALSVEDRANLHALVTALQQVDIGELARLTALEVVDQGYGLRLTTLEGKAFTVQRKVASTPALLLGGTGDIPIVWDTPFTDTAYGIYPVVEASGIYLGKISAQLKAGTKTKTGCTITVVSQGLAIAANQTLDVLAVRYGT